MEFKKVKLRDVCTVNQGLQIPISKRFKEKAPNRYFYITIQFLKGNTEEYYIENPKESVLCTKKDILVVRTGSTGIVLTDVEGCFHNNFFKVVPNEKIYRKYLYYALNNEYMYKKMLNAASGTTIPDLKHSAFYDLEIFLPEINEQYKIVNILENIDKKIKLNNQINNNLYELTNNLFKKIFEENEVKEYKRLDEISECQNGHAFYKDGYNNRGLMVIDLGNINLNSNFIYTNADKYIDKSRIPNEKFIVRKNDLVMIMTDRKATMDLLGKTAKIYENKEYALNQRIYRIRSKINVNYLYTYLNSDKVSNELKSKALGSVQKYINTNVINEIRVPIFENKIMEDFSNIVNPIFEFMESNILENKNLEQLRDTLLPKLMNGEINLDKVEI